MTHPSRGKPILGDTISNGHTIVGDSGQYGASLLCSTTPHAPAAPRLAPLRLLAHVCSTRLPVLMYKIEISRGFGSESRNVVAVSKIVQTLRRSSVCDFLCNVVAVSQRRASRLRWHMGVRCCTMRFDTGRRRGALCVCDRPLRSARSPLRFQIDFQPADAADQQLGGGGGMLGRRRHANTRLHADRRGRCLDLGRQLRRARPDAVQMRGSTF